MTDATGERPDLATADPVTASSATKAVKARRTAKGTAAKAAPANASARPARAAPSRVGRARAAAGEPMTSGPEAPPASPAPSSAFEAATAREPSLSVANLGFRYGDRVALDDVSFDVRPGVFTALLGPNGAGKTTLFSLITRLFLSPSGTIRIAGRDLRTSGAAALAPLGVVFQSPTLEFDLTVRRNLTYCAALHGLEGRAAVARIERELAAVDMLDRMDTPVRSLNGGHRRRVEIARALLHDPDLILLDEATVGLDVTARRAIVDRVHALARERDIGVLWTTHLIDEVAPDDDLVVLHRGRILARGTASDVTRATGCETLQAAFEALTAADGADQDGGRSC